MATWTGKAKIKLRRALLYYTLRRPGPDTLIDKGYLYHPLNNRVYRGEALHKGKAYPGEQTPSSMQTFGIAYTPFSRKAPESVPTTAAHTPLRC